MGWDMMGCVGGRETYEDDWENIASVVLVLGRTKRYCPALLVVGGLGELGVLVGLHGRVRIGGFTGLEGL